MGAAGQAGSEAGVGAAGPEAGVCAVGQPGPEAGAAAGAGEAASRPDNPPNAGCDACDCDAAACPPWTCPFSSARQTRAPP